MSQKTLESLTPPDAHEHENRYNAAPDSSAAEADWEGSARAAAKFATSDELD